MRNIVDIEKTIEFILSHQANAEVQMQKFREGMAELWAAQAAQAEAQAAAVRAQTEALTAQSEAQTAALAAQAEAQTAALTAHSEAQAAALAAQVKVQAKGYEEHERVMARIDARLDRAVRLSIRDARHERKRRQEMAEEWDRKVTQLSAAQLMTEEQTRATEESLRRFIDSMQRGTNGHT